MLWIKDDRFFTFPLSRGEVTFPSPLTLRWASDLGYSRSDVLILPSLSLKGTESLYFLPLGSQLPYKKPTCLGPPCCKKAQAGFIGGMRHQMWVEPSWTFQCLPSSPECSQGNDPSQCHRQQKSSCALFMEAERIIIVVLNPKLGDSILVAVDNWR